MGNCCPKRLFQNRAGLALRGHHPHRDPARAGCRHPARLLKIESAGRLRVCRPAGQTLPTVRHWETALGLSTNARALMSRLSNFKGEGAAAVGTYGGISAFGASDMGGNVREWCWNATR